MKAIFVTNLDFDTTEASLRALFEPHGAVERVRVVLDTVTGRSRGFAFVEMTDPVAADRAIAALNGASLDHRALYISEALAESDRGAQRARSSVPTLAW